MRYCFFLVVLLIGSNFAVASDFSGRWTGMGVFDHSSLDQPIPIRSDVRIKQTQSELKIQECWAYELPDGKQEGDCIYSNYDLRHKTHIYSKSRKIGDLFYHKFQTFISNSQVSEQMLYQRISEKQMRLSYSYSNMDGASIHRKVVLKRQ